MTAADQSGAVHGIPVTRLVTFWCADMGSRLIWLLRFDCRIVRLQVVVPCKVEEGHRVVCVVDLQAWQILVYDPKAHWTHVPGSRICQQILPLRRLFPLICSQAGYFERTNRQKYDVATMKARRTDASKVPKQICGKSNGVLVLLMIRSLLRGLRSVKCVESDIQSHRYHIAYEIFTNSLPEEC